MLFRGSSVKNSHGQNFGSADQFSKSAQGAPNQGHRNDFQGAAGADGHDLRCTDKISKGATGACE